MEMDPLLLSKGKPGTGETGLFDYVNDRPYVSSSFLCNAMTRCFGTAMTGRCDQRKELADSELDLVFTISMLPVRGDKELVNRFFEPLGYEIAFETFLVDEKFPEWGESPYVNLTLATHKRLSEALNQIYVMISVFDMQKHYYVSEAEIDNLLKHGEGWIDKHPEKEYIIRRYFYMAKSYADTALEKLGSNEHGEDNQYKKAEESQAPLDKVRLQSVKEEVLAAEAHSVIDIGCGEGKLLALLVTESQTEKLAGTDVSTDALKRAEQKI